MKKAAEELGLEVGSKIKAPPKHLRALIKKEN
jgi:hypothetical protein